jgi:hypothetical protein
LGGVCEQLGVGTSSGGQLDACATLGWERHYRHSCQAEWRRVAKDRYAGVGVIGAGC